MATIVLDSNDPLISERMRIMDRTLSDGGSLEEAFGRARSITGIECRDKDGDSWKLIASTGRWGFRSRSDGGGEVDPNSGWTLSQVSESYGPLTWNV